MQYLNKNSSVKPVAYCHTVAQDEQKTTNSHLNKKVKIVQKPRVLVVEDEETSQIVARIFLTKQGYECDIAKSGEEALNLFIRNDYQVILMDVGLPGIDGLETTRRIRNLEKGHDRHTPIIACTANGAEYKQRCLDAGMDEFSVKPFNFSALDLLLKTWL